MKNNEIMISAKFIGQAQDHKEIAEEMSFLVLKDITLKALLEAIYYGIKKLNNEELFALLETYLKTRKELQVLYNAKGDFNIIDVSEEYEETEVINGEEKQVIKKMYEKKLDALGFVTSSCIVFTQELVVSSKSLFEKNDKSYILKSNDSLEYNISTRRLNVIEPSIIDIIPPNEMPQKDKSSILDVIIPTVLSTGGMLVARFMVMAVAPSAASMGNTMLLMSGAMGVVAMVTTLYNHMRQKNKYRKDVEEWKSNYENYIHKKIKTIKEWQKSDIKYLNSVYPNMEKLLQNTAEISSAIFSRSQNDKDFMKISLGTSDEVKPLFEIKSEKKDNIFYDIYYKKIGDKIEIFIPSQKRKKGQSKLTPSESDEENKNKFLLTDLAFNFANKGIDPKNSNESIGFNYLRSDDNQKPPLLLDLKNCGTLGVISNDTIISKNFIKHIIYELSYYHSPEDLQFVFFFDKDEQKEEQDKLLELYQYLPHANELFEDTSQFVFDKDKSGIVFGNLLSIMNERNKSKSDSEDGAPEQKIKQIVCIVFDDYNIKETGFSKYLPEVPKEGEPYINKNGLTFIFIQSLKDKLPKYCGNIINLHNEIAKERKSSLRYNVLSREVLNALSEGNEEVDKANDTDKLIEYKHFANDYIFYDYKTCRYDEKYKQAFKQLSAIYYTRIAENGKVPSMVSLFELYGYNAKMIENNEVRQSLLDNWKNIDKNDVTKDLCVPIGKNEYGPVYLDLYEKADGPHMLVAGTTGSGKSETIITYLIGLCMKYSPLDLNLMLVDMKGGGFSDRLGKLPHCVGDVSDTAGEDEGTSASYMLKRFLESLNAEIKRRKLLLSSLGVDNADAYIRAIRLIRHIQAIEGKANNQEEIASLKQKLNDKQLEAFHKHTEDLVTLSHLVLVVDEFTELKRFSNESNDIDFIAEITTIARVGRTLGFHIVLVSQNIEGAITDDIRVNSKARICLKVATKQASKEMIDSPVAAAPTMPLNGRAYLLVGTGTRFEYFQSAYTGANKNVSIEQPVQVKQVKHVGKFNNDFYSSKKDNDIERKKNKNISENDTQLAYITKTIIEIGRNFEKPRNIFLPSLSSTLIDETDWR